MPKILVEEFFTVAVISGTGNCLDKKGGVSRFSVENLLSHGVGKTSVRESFVALISGAEKVWRRGGGKGSIKISLRQFLFT